MKSRFWPFFLLLNWGSLLFAQEALLGPPSPRLIFQDVLAGRFQGDPVIFPDGRIFALNEDKGLHGWLPDGTKILTVHLSGRSEPYLAQGPRPGESLLLFTIDKRLHLYSALGKLLWSYPLDGQPSAPPVVYPGGLIFVATQSGSLYCLNPEGQLIWSQFLGQPVQQILGDISQSFYLRRGIELQCWDFSGRLRWKREFPRPLTFLSGGPEGQVWTGYENRVCEVSLEGEVRWWKSNVVGSPLEVLTRPETKGLVLVTDKSLLVIDESEQIQGQRSWNSSPGSHVALAVDGTLYGSTSGLFSLWDPQLKPLHQEKLEKPPSGLGLSSQGQVVLLGEDWRIRVMQASPVWFLGWSQSRGDPSRQNMIPREGDYHQLLALWRQDTQFVYFYQLLLEGRRKDQVKILEEMEALHLQEKLESTWPFASIILLEIVRSGVEHVVTDDGRNILNNYPELRHRAYRLLESLPQLRVRRSLLALTRLEYDQTALRALIRTLGKIAYDVDGRSLRALAVLWNQERFRGALVEDILEALAHIYRYNRRMTDPSGLDLLIKIFRGNFPVALRNKALALFQEVLK